jgi:gluconokinase
MNQILVMGVCGSGKTAVGVALAHAISARFIEGDDYHSASNIARMSAGLPLDDAARAPWLTVLAGELRNAAASNESVVLACSALKEAYRARLRDSCPALRTIWLDVPHAVLEQRLRSRHSHFMPASLLTSQLADLEVPRDAIVVKATIPLHKLVTILVGRLSQVCPR